MKLMSDWEEMEGLQENFDDLKFDDKDLEDEVQKYAAPKASQLDPNVVTTTLIEKGVKPSGFNDENIIMLQEIFDKESKIQEEQIRLQRLEDKKKAAQQKGLQKKRMDMEQKLSEEIDELAKNYQVSSMIDCVIQNKNIQTLRLDINSISARALAKAMWANHTIICLDLSSNNLNDNAGMYIARILKRNNIIKKMELDNNLFGIFTAKAFAESLLINTSLVTLSLDSNPLTGSLDAPDISGIIEFSTTLAQNKTLKFLNLWRTNLGIGGGEALALQLEMNETILFCDVGHNNIHTQEAIAIATILERNLAAYEANERCRRKELLEDSKKETAIQNAAEVV
jgi:hypothetical protein